MQLFLWFIIFLTGCSNSNVPGGKANVQDESTIYEAKVKKYSTEDAYKVNSFSKSKSSGSLETVIYFEYDSAIVRREYDKPAIFKITF